MWPMTRPPRCGPARSRRHAAGHKRFAASSRGDSERPTAGGRGTALSQEACAAGVAGDAGIARGVLPAGDADLRAGARRLPESPAAQRRWEWLLRAWRSGVLKRLTSEETVANQAHDCTDGTARRSVAGVGNPLRDRCRSAGRSAACGDLTSHGSAWPKALSSMTTPAGRASSNTRPATVRIGLARRRPTPRSHGAAGNATARRVGRVFRLGSKE
jgi:hypothetical protein